MNSQDKNLLFRRILLSVFGVLICGISVGLFKLAMLGVDPFQSFTSGLHKLIPISYGTLYMILCIIFLAFSLIFNRQCIGIATFINLFLLGYVVDFSYQFFLNLFGQPTLLGRFACLLIGFLIICFSSSMYMTANLGVSTYDAVAITLAYKWKLGKFRFIRIICDSCCVILAIIFCKSSGGSWDDVWAIVGVGTVLTALGMGPLIDFFNTHIFQPFLHKNEA